MGRGIPNQLFKEQQGRAGPAGGGARTRPRARPAGSCLAGGAHQWALCAETPLHWQRTKKRRGKRRGKKREEIRKEKKYKGKWRMRICPWSTQCWTLQSIVSCSTFSRSWKDRLHKFFPPNCDFLVGSKCRTKVSERGLALPHMRATKPPQAWVTCIFLASAAVVFIPKSCTFTSGEVVPSTVFSAAEVFWVGCVAVAVLGSLVSCWGTRAEQENEQRQQGEHWAGSRHPVPGIAACWWSCILGIMALTPPWGPWAFLPCWVLCAPGVAEIPGCLSWPSLAQLPRDPAEPGFICVWVLVLMTSLSDGTV